LKKDLVAIGEDVNSPAVHLSVHPVSLVNAAVADKEKRRFLLKIPKLIFFVVSST